MAEVLLDEDFLEGGADGRLLVVTALAEGGAVGHEEQGGRGAGQVDAQVPGITGGEFRVGREVREGVGPAGHAAALVEFRIAVAVSAEDITHCEAGAVRVAAGLFHALEGIGSFGLGLDHPNRQRGRHFIEPDTQEIVGAAAAGTPAAFVTHRLHRSRRLQSDPPLPVALFPQDRVDEFKTGFGFVIRHEPSILGMSGESTPVLTVR